jgi:hypothetical protein
MAIVAVTEHDVPGEVTPGQNFLAGVVEKIRSLAARLTSIDTSFAPRAEVIPLRTADQVDEAERRREIQIRAGVASWVAGRQLEEWQREKEKREAKAA